MASRRTARRTASRATRSRSSARSAQSGRGRDRQLQTKGQVFLNRHDEEKLLLFTTGIVFGVGLAATLLEKFVFGGLAALVIALVLIFIEDNQKYHG